MEYKKILNYLKVLVKNKKLITYTELNEKLNLGFNLKLEIERVKFGKVLGEIAKTEHEKGKPLISCIVYVKNSIPKKCGKGFFNLAYELGKIKKLDKKTTQEFLYKELRELGY